MKLLIIALTGWILAQAEFGTYSPAWLQSEFELKNVPSEVRGDGVYIILPSVSFKFGSYKINDEARSMLLRAAEILNSRRAVHTVLLSEGHASSEGDDQYNLNLSKGRAKEVASIIIDAGLSASRVTISGKGEEYADQEGYGKVVFVIVKQE